MIFVTVGTQLPFDRLLKTIDRWAGETGRSDVYAQIGPGAWQPKFIGHDPFIDASKFRQCVADASVVIAHAGMGSIITALELGKPILIMPRRAHLLEQRNDHQMATARQLHRQGRASVAFDEIELQQMLMNIDQISAAARISTSASPRLIATIRDFIAGGSVPTALREEAAFDRAAGQMLVPQNRAAN